MAKSGMHAHIWAYVFGHNSAIFGPIGLKRRELRRLLSIDWWWQIQVMMLSFHFWILGNFWRENGRVHHARPLCSGASKPDLKVGPIGELLDQPLSGNHIFEIFTNHSPIFFENIIVMNEWFFSGPGILYNRQLLNCHFSLFPWDCIVYGFKSVFNDL